MPRLIQDHLIGTIRDAKGALLECIIISTAIELCGSFITGQTRRKKTKSNFLAFWESKYMPEKYHGKGELIYEILRNGVVHSFVPKGGVIPSGDTNSLNLHWEFTNFGIVIHTTKLKEDVINGIKQFAEDLEENKNGLKDNRDRVLGNLIKDGEDRYKNFIKKNNISIKNIHLISDVNPD